MMTARALKWVVLVGAGGVLLQWTSCLVEGLLRLAGAVAASAVLQAATEAAGGG